MKCTQYLSHNTLIHLHFRNFNNFLINSSVGSVYVILILSLWIAFATVNNRIVIILLSSKKKSCGI